MTRLCCGCLCCISRKKRKSFPINEIQRKTEVNKISIRYVESIRLTPPLIKINRQQDKNTKSKATMKNKSNDTEFKRKQTIKENNSSKSRTPVSKLFQKSRQLQTPSPLPMTIDDIPPGENHDKTFMNSSLSWSSSTTNSDSKQQKNSKHRSYIDSYDFSKENLSQKKNISQPKRISNDIKSPAKSKLILENVRKMIKDPNIQQQHFNHTRQKESARL